MLRSDPVSRKDPDIDLYDLTIATHVRICQQSNSGAGVGA